MIYICFQLLDLFSMLTKKYTSHFNTTLLCSLAILASTVTLIGCQNAYYAGMEKIGIHKRDIFIDRVEDARDAQEDAKEQFESALDQFQSVISIKSTSLEKKYKKLQAEFDNSEAAANEVSERIAAVQHVSNALFKEWQNELNLYTNASLKRDSARKLATTKQRYVKLIAAMKKAESRMHPVLNAFRDQVLFLKHNLNAQAIASLQNELSSIEASVSILIAEMERSIRESNAFVAQLKAGS